MIQSPDTLARRLIGKQGEEVLVRPELAPIRVRFENPHLTRFGFFPAAAKFFIAHLGLKLRCEKLTVKPVVSVSVSRQMMAAIEQTRQPARPGSVVYTHGHHGDGTGLPDTTLARLIAAGARLLSTEYPIVGHNSWVPAYDSPLLVRWLFAQNRKKVGSTGVR